MNNFTIISNEKKKSIQINEITLRDGLQNIKYFIPTEKKRHLLNLLVKANVTHIESTAFVNPKWVPQMVDASDMCITTKEIDGIHNSVLVPNLNGFRKAEACGAEEIVAFFSASEIHNRKNVNRSVSESLEEIGQIAIASIKSGIIPRVNIATAFGYQKTESITDELIISFVKKLEAFGFVGITLCDTTGIAEPNRVYSLCHKIMTIQKKSKLAIHLHQSSGIEFASLYAAYKAGVTQFETAAGGLGGCPYALEADGNIPTETTVSLFNRMGLICDIDEDAIKVAANYAKQLQREYSKTE